MLFSATDNPRRRVYRIEAWDSEGRPCLPDTIDDSPSPGIPPPGSLVDIDFETGRSLISSLAEQLNWKT